VVYLVDTCFYVEHIGGIVWIKPLLAQARYNKCKHLSYVLCAAFFQECISIMIMGFPINEIPPQGEKVLQR
jgi:hypothetical protein